MKIPKTTLLSLKTIQKLKKNFYVKNANLKKYQIGKEWYLTIFYKHNPIPDHIPENPDEIRLKKVKKTNKTLFFYIFENKEEEQKEMQKLKIEIKKRKKFKRLDQKEAKKWATNHYNLKGNLKYQATARILGIKVKESGEWVKYGPKNWFTITARIITKKDWNKIERYRIKNKLPLEKY